MGGYECGFDMTVLFFFNLKVFIKLIITPIANCYLIFFWANSADPDETASIHCECFTEATPMSAFSACNALTEMKM